MRRLVTKNSARVVEFVDLDHDPLAIYPDQICAARMVGCSRQAIHQAIKNGTKVNGHFWMKLFDYDLMRVAEQQAQKEHSREKNTK